jgi:hypothetical protein
MNKLLAIVFCGIVCLSAAQLATVQLVRAQEERTTIFVKEYIDEVEPVELIISLYDQSEGGALLYQLTQVVTPEEGIFDEPITVPAEILSQYHQVFIEFAKASSPSEPLAAERMQYTHRVIREDIHGTDIQPSDLPGRGSIDVSLCFTCGGFYPREAGAISAGPGSHNHQRGPRCSGPLRNIIDRRPRICVFR